MELYQIIATVNNTSTTFQLAYLPENFEGVKISQAFSFVNPIGYNPKFSVDTMRIILSDKAAIDTVFNTYVLQSDVTLLIKKLNTSGIGYSNLATFAIDFESYEIQDEFSEFALKSVSVMDYYNNIKNTERLLGLTEDCLFPTTQTLINYVSLKSKMVSPITGQVQVVEFEKNNESKIFNTDTALINPIKIGGVDYFNIDMYNMYFETESGFVDFFMSISGMLKFSLSGNSVVYVRLMKYDNEDFSSTILQTVATINGVSGINEIDLGNLKIDLSGYYGAGLSFYMKIEADTASIDFSMHGQSVFADIKINSDELVIQESNFRINYIETEAVLNSFFNSNLTIENSLKYLGITSAQHLLKLDSFAIVKPKEFLSDFCIATGSMLNFKTSGSAEIKTITAYFNALLNTANAIAISDFKELSIKYYNQLNLSSVSVGCQPKEYDAYTYFIDWNKVLTFKQTNRNAIDNVDLSLSKIRTDFSGMLDLIYKRSKQSDLKINETYLFKPDFPLVDYKEQISPELYLYDHFNPRAILDSWTKYLSFAFQNFGLNNLTISSNGGTVDDLNIHGVDQMDDLLISQTPRLLPIQYDFTCLLDSVDFSEKILKINDKGTDIYLFVINAETTDNLSEQKISGLKIQF